MFSKKSGFRSSSYSKLLSTIRENRQFSAGQISFHRKRIFVICSISYNKETGPFIINSGATTVIEPTVTYDRW